MPALSCRRGSASGGAPRDAKLTSRCAVKLVTPLINLGVILAERFACASHKREVPTRGGHAGAGAKTDTRMRLGAYFWRHAQTKRGHFVIGHPGARASSAVKTSVRHDGGASGKAPTSGHLTLQDSRKIGPQVWAAVSAFAGCVFMVHSPADGAVSLTFFAGHRLLPVRPRAANDGGGRS